MQPAGRLQWGRAYKSAELCNRREDNYPAGDGFNGAALTRARSCIGGAKLLYFPKLASMGPRLQERGVWRFGGFGGLSRQALQWGRAYKSAELSAQSPEVARATTLQWGRAYKSAELNRQMRVSPRTLIASMGPRLQERGVTWIRHTHCHSENASMGPRLQERGVQLRDMPDADSDGSFNGAALTRARSLLGQYSLNAYLVTLQWGRAYKSAEF